MATNLKIDDTLVMEALKLSGSRTKREAVNLALKEFVAKRRQLKFLELEGKIEFDPAYDYREQRNRT
jgi:Arc/MetJ family transcription regulator